MKRPEDHQATLIGALTEVASGPDSPPYMSPDKEAIALLVQMRKVEGLLRDGYCPLASIMALAQQAIRVAAMGCVQSDQRESVVTRLMAKTVPSASN